MQRLDPQSAEPYGYTTQLWIVRTIIQQFGIGPQYTRFWFARAFNPPGLPPSSNPARLYLMQSQAVHTRDSGSKLVDPTINAVRSSIIFWEGAGALSQTDAQEARRWVDQAELTALKPEVWRLNLAAIASNRGQSVEDLLDEARQAAVDEIQAGNQRAGTRAAARQLTFADEYLLYGLDVRSLALDPCEDGQQIDLCREEVVLIVEH